MTSVVINKKMNRFLHILLSLLLLVSAPVGASVQTAVFSPSDDLKIVKVHASAQEMAPALVAESDVIERTVVRSQKKSANLQEEFSNDAFCENARLFLLFPSFSAVAPSSSRVLLLPKSLQTVIFLQTVL